MLRKIGNLDFNYKRNGSADITLVVVTLNILYANDSQFSIDNTRCIPYLNLLFPVSKELVLFDASLTAEPEVATSGSLSLFSN